MATSFVKKTGLFPAALACLAVGWGCVRGPSGSSSASLEERVALLAGASGETVEPNFFVEDLRGLRDALAARGWEVSVVAGGRDGLLPGSARATNENLARGVRQTLERARPGHEALILFHSHGREQETYWGQRSHSIVSEDRDASGADPGFDLDTIEPALLKARDRGVRVALVDLSCYSGATQALQGPACTVSLAGSRYVSLCSGRPEERHFNSHFFKLPSAGKTVDLETQFLAARREDRDSINLPQISSRVSPGLAGWESFLVTIDPLDTFEELKNLSPDSPPFAPKDLLSEVDRWITANPDAAADPRSRGLRAEIEQKLARVLALKKTLRSRMPELSKDYDDPALSVEVPGRRPMKLGAAYLAELLQSSESGRVPEGYTDVQRGLVKAISPLRQQLASRFTEPLARFRERRDRFDQLADELARASGSLFESERRLYELKPRPKESNPCRDFQL